MHFSRFLQNAAYNQILRSSVHNVVNKRLSSHSAIVYYGYGNPTEVLKHEPIELKKMQSDEVHVKMIAAPINPANINTIQGVYPYKPEFPAIAGGEGVGEIIAVGTDVSIFKPGDKVLAGGAMSGSWRTDAICSQTKLVPLPSDISVVDAATLTVNPTSAYRMLNDFVTLHEGEYIIQNGANSGVGQAVIQIAKHMKINTINIVRDRDNMEKLTDSLKSKGATHVITDTFLKSKDIVSFMKDIPAPRLALNCVGGKITAEIFKHVANGATVVTYGAMSKQPMMVPAGSLIFKDIVLKGYWMSRWMEEHHTSTKRANMLKMLCELIRRGKLKTTDYRMVDIGNFKAAIEKSMEPYHTEKQILYLAGDHPLKSKVTDKIY